MPYPTELTTSEWVDHLETLPSRDEKIAALATLHRRIEAGAQQAAIEQVKAQATIVTKTEVHPDVIATLDAAMAAVPQLGDYQPADQSEVKG